MVDSRNAIAVIGIACRLPGAADSEEFWGNLVAGTESVRFGTLAEQAALGVPQDVLDDPRFVPVSAVLDAPEYFDAGFFRMPAEEARHRDPQQRLFLELAHTALEDGSHDPGYRRQVIGVYAASGEDAYQWQRTQGIPGQLAPWAPSGTPGPALPLATLTGQVASLASWKLDLRGPSLTLSGPGATSLAAVHLACHALRDGECDLALAGGVNIDLPLGRGYIHADSGDAPRDGHCRAFDVGASGAVPASGGAVILLKRLADALADGDQIRAVVIGSAVNHDGAGKAAFAAPSREGQATAVSRALACAGVDPRTIGYIEAHGAGTQLGDAIEVAALSAAFGDSSRDAGWCAIGTVKTNIGHLGPAAGIAGLAKAVLALENRLIPASLNYQSPNPQIDFADSPFHVNATLSSWDPAGSPRRAGVNSFAVGGANAHVVLEEAPIPDRPRRDRRPVHLLQISARTPAALTVAAGRLSARLAAAAASPGDALELADVAHTLRTGRRALAARMAVAARDTGDAAACLAGSDRAIIGMEATAQVALMFPGCGAEYANMGAQLRATEPAFSEALEHCCDLVGAESGADLRTAMLTTGQAAEDELRRPGVPQAALFTVGYALAQQWRSWGITPTAMIGHGVGEYTAAAIAGVFSLPDALRAVIACGRLAPGTPPVTGGSLGASGTGQVPMTSSAAAEFQELLTAVSPRAPELPYLSSLTGDWITSTEATDPAYWVRQARETVRFCDGLSELLREEGWLLVECGPGTVLCDLARRHRPGTVVMPSLPGRDDHTSDLEVIYSAAGRLWASGARLDRSSFGPAGYPVRLPSYPWERERFWLDPPAVSEPGVSEPGGSEPGGTGPPPPPDSVAADDGYVPPRTGLEEAVARIWAEEIGLDRVGVTDNFFMLGGDSITAIRVLDRIRQEAGVDLTMEGLLESGTVRDSIAGERFGDEQRA